MKARKKRSKSQTRAKKRPVKKRNQLKTAKRNTTAKTSKLKKSARGKARSKSRKGAVRRYSMATIKELFALCSNHCAFPGCTNEIVAAGTEWSKAAVVGHICHIYAASDKGPRGKPGLTEAERNSSSNLILMCGYHHPLIDKQWQTYPSTLLKKWKKAHEAKAMKGTAEAIKRESDIDKHVFFQEMSDNQIENALTRIRRARFLVGYSAAEEAQTFANQVEQSRYSSGSAEARARALAWCARILAQGKTMVRAKELLRKSREIAATPEAALAQAVVTAATKPREALAALAEINTPAALSVALRIVTNKEGAKKALAWVSSSRLSVDSFDAEGKFTLITNALSDGEWAAATKFADSVAEGDFIECPILLYAVAMARLLMAVPTELRAVAFSQVPFEVDSFPLASTPEKLAERRTARNLFERLSTFAQEVGITEAANIASDYALWLGLRDSDAHNAAMIELRDSLSDPAKSLRRVNFAIRFGLKVDFAAIEERINQGIALSGKGTPDEAFARLSLAFTKESPQAVAEYIEKYRAQLYEHLRKESIIVLEIEALARAGLTTTARERLQQAVREGLNARDRDLAEGALAEASGSDPIAERRAIYEATGALPALVNLVDALERARLWQDMLPYAERLFAANPSVETYARLVHCLNEMGRYDELLASMLANPGLIYQSENLKLVWAWTLYREGRFAEATTALQRLSNRRDANARTLMVNIAVASGAWDKLLEFCQDSWNERDQYSAADLMHAAQISLAVNGPHSRDLVIAATEKEPDNPEILASAYLQATKAGWEQSPAVAGWLDRAAKLSWADGPLTAISMQELLEKKPEWDKQAEAVWDQLKKGKVPTFAAGQLLKRSLLDFYLLPSLANPSEVDVRKRSIVFAYSGARLPVVAPQPTTLALDLAAIITFSRLGLLNKVLSRYKSVIPHSTLSWLFQERQEATFHQPSRVKDAAVIKQLISNGTLSVVRPAMSGDHKLVRQVGAELAALLSTAREKSATGTKALVVRSAPLHRLGTILGEEADISGYEGCICNCSAVIDYLKIKGALTQPEEQRARNYLKLHERPWPNEPVIGDQTEVYLDRLSVSYLLAGNILGKLKVGGLKAYIAESEDKEASALLNLEGLGKRQLEYIEQIRSTLAAGIETGRIKAARTINQAGDDDLFRLHPTFGALSLVTADAIVVDDRFVNQHPTMTNERQTKPVLCSLDVLNLLHAGGEISVEDLFAHRTVLRQTGYQLMTVMDDELLYQLMAAPVVNGELIETAELRAIRESLLQARMVAIVQLPTEANFLLSSLNAHVRAIKATWETLQDKAEAKARAEYLLAQVDVRKWASSAIKGSERAFVLNAYTAYALQIVSPPLKANRTIRADYYEWVTGRFLAPIKETQPEVYESIVGRARELVVRTAEQGARKVDVGQ